MFTEKELELKRTRRTVFYQTVFVTKMEKVIRQHVCNPNQAALKLKENWKGIKYRVGESNCTKLYDLYKELKNAKSSKLLSSSGKV